MTRGLTARETQILDMLKRNPLLAQDDLAGSLGISRSAAAVHISNLIRKGYIIGRGYLFNELPRLVAVGTAGVETRGVLTGHDGKGSGWTGCISRHLWGGALRTALMAARNGVPVSLVSAVGRDADGDHLVAAVDWAGVGMRHVIRSNRRNTAQAVTWKDKGEIWQMREQAALVEVSPEFIRERCSLLCHADLLFVDDGLDETTLAEVLSAATSEGLPMILQLTSEQACTTLCSYAATAAVTVVDAGERGLRADVAVKLARQSRGQVVARTTAGLAWHDSSKDGLPGFSCLSRSIGTGALTAGLVQSLLAGFRGPDAVREAVRCAGSEPSFILDQGAEREVSAWA